MYSDIQVERKTALQALNLVADAVLYELTKYWNNLGSQSTFTYPPEKIYDTELQLEDTQIASMDVVVGDVQIEMFTRKLRQYDCRIDVAIRKKINPISNQNIDDLLIFSGDVLEVLSPNDENDEDSFFRPLTMLPEAVWLKGEVLAPYIPDHIRSLNQFTCILMVTYRMYG